MCGTTKSTTENSGCCTTKITIEILDVILQNQLYVKNSECGSTKSFIENSGCGTTKSTI